MSDLITTWLRAQLDWAETDASQDHTFGCKVRDLPPGADDYPDEGLDFTNPDACDCKVRPRLLDVQAKRQILDAVERYLNPHPGQPCTNEGVEYYEDEGCTLHIEWMAGAITPYVLPLLALPFADRPGYLEEWKP